MAQSRRAFVFSRRTLIALLVIGYCLGATARAFAKEVVEYFPDGSKRLVYNINPASQRDGQFVEYYESGKKKIEAGYRDGEYNGVYKQFTPEGKLALQVTYKDGVKHGPFLEQSPETDKRIVRNYRDGKLHGAYQDYVAGELVVDQLWWDDKLVFPQSATLMTKRLHAIRSGPAETIGDEPTVPEIYRAGYADAKLQLKREKALRELKAYRMICGVPHENVKMERERIAHAQAGADLARRHGELDHTPPNPGLPESDYQFGYEGTSHCNLHQGTSLDTAVHGWMEDSDPSNIDVLGHRRWCLDPRLTLTGFGESEGFCAMWAQDNDFDAKVPDEVMYPARGFMPTQFIGAGHAWHIQLNEQVYAPPDRDKVRAQIIPVAVDLKEGKVTPAGQALPLDYHHVDTESFYGFAVIFRPAKFKVVRGKAYMVRVAGLTDLSGQAKPIEYLVVFFKA